MEVKKYNPFVVMNKHKPKAKPQAKLKAKCLSLENKEKLDIIHAWGFVKTSRK